MGKKIIRVFPRKTNATPDDDHVRVGVGPSLFDEADEVHISVSFTWDLPVAEWLEKQWRHVAKTRLGGPATGEAGKDFTPGMYVKKGYVITSRGCNNRCWFCSVWKREGNVRELPVAEGWNVLDDNLLSCSFSHVDAVFSMLEKQQGVQFTGGLEAKILDKWHVDRLRKIKPKQMFFAYDTPDDLEPLQRAGQMLHAAGLKSACRAYVLCGYPKDTFESAEKRMTETINAGFMPMAMLYRDEKGKRTSDWMKWQRQWARPAIIRGKMRDAQVWRGKEER